MIGHALPNALLPVVTLGGLAYAQLLTGTVLTETIFSWPGLGRYTFHSAITARLSGDHGHHAVVATVYVVINLLVDFPTRLLDPRVVATMSGVDSRTLASAKPAPRAGAGCGVTVSQSLGAAVICSGPCGIARTVDRAVSARRWSTSPPSVAAIGRALARHRCAGPRCVHARASMARGPRSLSASSWCWSPACRHVAWRRRRLCARLGRGSADAPTDLVFCFPPIILAMAIAAALGHRHAQYGHRHAGCVVAEIRPPRTQPGDRAARAGICRGGAGRSVLARRTSCCAKSCPMRWGR